MVNDPSETPPPAPAPEPPPPDTSWVVMEEVRKAQEEDFGRKDSH